MMHINFRFHFTATRQYIDYGFNPAGTMHAATAGITSTQAYRNEHIPVNLINVNLPATAATQM